MRTLLSQCIYGGKVDNEFDQVLFSNISSEKLFCIFNSRLKLKIYNISLAKNTRDMLSSFVSIAFLT